MFKSITPEKILTQFKWYMVCYSNIFDPIYFCNVYMSCQAGILISRCIISDNYSSKAEAYTIDEQKQFS